jgi:hypothetical protein
MGRRGTFFTAPFGSHTMSGHTFALALVLLCWLTVALAVGVDAARRGRRGDVWGVITFLTGPVGLVVYVLVVLGSIARHPGDEGDDDTDDGATDGGDGDAPVAHVVRSGARGYCSNCSARVALDADGCSTCGALL